MDNTEQRNCIFIKRVVPGLIGGIPIVDNRNQKALEEVFNKVFVIEFPVQSLSFSLNHLCLRVKALFFPIDDAYNQLIEQIEKVENVDVFFSSSKFGPEVNSIRKMFPNVKIHVFFHNVESTMSMGRYRDAKGFKDKLIEFFSYIRNLIGEEIICKKATNIFTLNSRDRNLLTKLYDLRQEKAYLLPMTLIDKLSSQKTSTPPTRTHRGFEKPLKLLFVGTAFWANIPGVKELIVSCMYDLKETAELYVVGNGMDSLRKELPYFDNVYYIGRVSDEELVNYYMNSDIFVAPITKGGGMKTKIAEAMMYGLPIIGTEEAFEGYEIPINEIGYCSNEICSYKTFILDISTKRDLLKRMSNKSRYFYEHFYSLNNTIERLKSAL